MYLDVFGDFPKDPLYFGYNSAGQETPCFVYFFRFRDLYGLKLTGDFSRIIIFQNMTIRSFGIKQTEPGRGKEQGGAPTCTLGRLGPPQPSIKSSRRFP